MSDPLHELQSAARKYAAHVLPGVVARRLIILDEHRERIAEVRIPACAEGETVGVGPAPPTIAPLALPGWDFSAPTPRFDGQPIAIHGRKRDLLKLLAESPIPLSVEQMKAAWGPDYTPEPGSVRWTVGDLRRALTSLFPGCGDPVHNDDAGYSLTIR